MWGLKPLNTRTYSWELASGEYEAVMLNGDHVDMTVIDRPVGSGRIVGATVDPAKVIVRRPSAATIINFGASRSFLKALGPGRWQINMPASTLREFLADAVTG
jgi:hypothetical protein